MIIEITAGTLESETKLITDTESLEAWRSMEKDIRTLKADGMIVEIPSEWADAEYSLDFLDDDFLDRVNAKLDAKQETSYVSNNFVSSVVKKWNNGEITSEEALEELLLGQEKEDEEIMD
jgi:DNA-nicking Smr family endonuclease